MSVLIELILVTSQVVFVTRGPQMIIDECKSIQKVVIGCMSRGSTQSLLTEKVRFFFSKRHFITAKNFSWNCYCCKPYTKILKFIFVKCLSVTTLC